MSECSIALLPADFAMHRLARLVPTDIGNEGAGGRIGARHAGYVGGQDDAGVIPEGMISGQRFRIGDVKDRSGNLALVDQVQQILLHQMTAPANIHYGSATGQLGEAFPAQYAACFRRQRQQADEDVAGRQEPRELVRPRVARDAADLVSGPAPAGPR